MRRREKTGGKTTKVLRLKTSPWRHDAPRVLRRRNPSSDDRETEIVRLSRELSEAFDQQAATAEILNIISNSPTDTQPVFDSIVQSGLKLFPDALISVALRDGDLVEAAAIADRDPDRVEAWRRTIFHTPLKREYMHGAAILDCRMVDVPDAKDPPTEFAAGIRNFLTSGYRAITIMPMVRGDEAIGLLSVVRLAPGPLSRNQIEVLRTFSAQAVIALENARLFEEVRARTHELSDALEQRTATAEVLQVISRSAFDLQPVFDIVAENSVRLCEADKAFIFRFDGELLRMVAAFNSPPEFKEWVAKNPIRPGRHSGSARAALERRTVHIHDVQADPEYSYGAKNVEAIRTILGVPILKGDDLLGVIMIYRLEVRPFSEKQIALVETFAGQAAIAIENVRLFEDAEARTRELSKSLEDLRAAQDRLVQTEKLASLGQLTAGIAHEIKNPLNFVNNFSGLSAELIDELQDVLGGMSIENKARAEINELTGILRGNLEKVVQHGQRADAIVKNMLLHSREGSGEHRPVDVNALVEESLSLAYHGARAEKQGFNITLERSFDPAAGAVDLFPQEITRALLNLITNGFYAATKRQAEADGGGLEPTLAVFTRNLGASVEIRICDNGTGIPSEIRDKMFNPFFTTKPAGEGTGLGLSISHDIIVKQHGGSIEVDTRPGEFTEFRIVLPRTAAPAPSTGPQTN